MIFCAPLARAQDKMLTVDDIYDPQKQINFTGSLPRISGWLPDGQHYLQINLKAANGPIGLLKVDAFTGKSEPYYDVAKMEKALAATPGLRAEDARQLSLLTFPNLNAAKTGALLNHNNDLYYYELNSERAVRLTDNSDAETDETFSPDGKYVAFVRNRNIYVVDLASGKERALTSDGGKNIYNGHLDWVYEEEIYGRGEPRSYWWSPDSSQIAFLRLDDSNVPEFTVVDDIPSNQKLELTHYPRAGEPNPDVKLEVVSVTGGEPHSIALAPYQTIEFLITRVGWTPDSKQVIFEAQNRVQTWLDLDIADAKSGAMRNLLKETSPAWVEVVDLPTWLPDGSFLWQSDRVGYRHIYHYSADGKLIGPVTKGEWDVRSLLGVNDGWIYFSASEHGRISDDIYRAKLDGSEFKRISIADGNHHAIFNAQLSAFIDLYSAITTPPKISLIKSDGVLARMIEENHVAALDQYKLGKVEFVKVPTHDGKFVMDAEIIKPPDFDPNKKYPVMSYTYSGPAIPSVRNSWGGSQYMWHQLLAQHGYIIWICDNRTASNQGAQSTYPVFHNAGELELSDLEDGLNWLKQQPYVDSSRIGLWGWSYGGYMTAYALTHSQTFKIGISGAPVTDWHNYDSIYTERYMGLPKDNPEGYRKSSVVEAAANLHGKLLLIHGAMDDNVHLQNSIQFIDALQRAGKEFKFMIYPESRHGVTQPLRYKHLKEMMTQFILENL
jgi:dipeptidyl-peptidase-4